MSERVAVLGIGRIGICLAINLERAGYDVLGIDKRQEHVASVAAGNFSSSEPGVEEALRAVRSLHVAADIGALREFRPGIVFIAVETTTGVEEYDQSPADRALAELCGLELGGDRTELSLVCTTLPGYCDSRAGALEKHNYALSYTPGFVAQGSILRDQQYPDVVLIGEADTLAGDRLECVYRQLCLKEPAVHRMPRLSAEIAKLATNCVLTMKIAFANAIGDLAARAGADPAKILNAIGADGRIGNRFLRYGYGYGGPCFPRDNRALNSYAQSQGYPLLQAEATDEMNRRHLAFQVDRYLQTYPREQEIHFYSVTYKPEAEMIDESQPLALAVLLAQAGRKVVIHEAPAVLKKLCERFGDLFEYRARVEENAREADAGPG
jgi:UDPglucose 6-dehydrogenase